MKNEISDDDFNTLAKKEGLEEKMNYFIINL